MSSGLGTAIAAAVETRASPPAGGAGVDEASPLERRERAASAADKLDL